MTTHEIEETRNIEVIRHILTKPDIFPYLIKNQSIDHDISFILDGKSQFFILFSDNLLAGLCIFSPISDKIHMGHIAILPDFRGKTAKDLAIHMLKKYFAENKEIDLVSRIIKENKRSIYFAQSIGFKIFWQNEICKYLILRQQNG